MPPWVENGTPEQLEVIRAIARERAAAGDPFLRDVVENAAARRNELKPAFRAFSTAWAGNKQVDADETFTHWMETAALLRRAGSPLALEAWIHAATSEYYAGRPGPALARLDEVEKELTASGNRYPGVAADALWARGLVLSQTGAPHGALDAYRRAAAEAARSGETELGVYVRALTASELELVGDPAEADKARLKSLRELDQINSRPDPLYVAFAEAASSALNAGRSRLALAFVDAQSRIARQQDDPLLIAESAAQRARAYLALGDVEAAWPRLNAARVEAEKIRTPWLRDRTLAQIEYTTGRAELQIHPDRAVSAFSAAIDLWQQHGWRVHSASALLARGEALLSLGDRDAAERDFRAGIADMEEQRRDLAEPSLRVAYFERADRLFERLIELLLAESRTADALSIAERKRSRCLLDQLAAPPGDSTALPLSGQDIAAATARTKTALLEITFVERGAELWLVHDGTIEHAQSGDSREAIDAAVTRHLDAIATNDAIAVRREGLCLYQQLIAPVAAAIPVGADLVIVPDGSLQAFPFATLIQPSGEFLIESFPLPAAPSASIYLRTPEAVAGNGSLVAVAQPAPAGFDALPFAEAEASAIAAAHPRGRLLVGEEVSPEQFLELAGEAAYIHFAGHARTDLDRPSQSALMFESASGSATLDAGTIAKAHLRAHPLVVLAGCSTGRGRLLRNEGMDSLAAAFLQAGARGVVATLWDVDDSLAGRLFQPFHANLRASMRPADALREAQRSLIHSKEPRDRRPKIWGSAVMVGPH